MAERPIIFSPEMSRAIREGRKTETRRVITERHGTDGTLLYPPDPKYDLQLVEGDSEGDYWIGCDVEGTTVFVRCPYGRPGDRLWVRETWQTLTTPEDRDPGQIVYSAEFDGKKPGFCEDDWSWRSPRFMPRWACRTVLEVVERFPQRLQEISEDDATAEGVKPYEGVGPDQTVPGPGFDGCLLRDQPHRLPFADLWDRINAKRGYPWDSNPWVWVIRFKVVED